MTTLPFDTSLTGYVSGSLDKQDDIYRNRQRPQPYPLVQTDSGYGSATPMRLDSVLTSSSSPTSLLGLADLVKCNELLTNASNFASESVIECYESDFYSTSMSLADQGVQRAVQSLSMLMFRQSSSVLMRRVFATISLYVVQAKLLSTE